MLGGPIPFEHCIQNARGWRLFDHQKPTVVRGCFCRPFSLFVTFFTVCNFCKLLFIVEGSPFVTFVTFLLLVTFVNYFLLLKGAKWVVLIYFLIVQNKTKLIVAQKQLIIFFVIQNEFPYNNAQIQAQTQTPCTMKNCINKKKCKTWTLF